MTLQINDRVLVHHQGKPHTGRYLGTDRERQGAAGVEGMVQVQLDDYEMVRAVPREGVVPLAEVRRRFVDLRDTPLTRDQYAALHSLMQDLTTRLHELPMDKKDDAATLVLNQMGGLAQFLALFKRAP